MTDASAIALNGKVPARTILLAWLLVATLDGASASIQTALYGRDPIGVYNYIASGVFGPQALTGGITYTLIGLLFHYFIAFCWTRFFFFIYPRVKAMSINRLATGVVYGLFIWVIMTRIVVPLSSTPKGPFRIQSALIGASILIVMIGLPLSFIAHKYFHATREK
jgi:hypothetical protein